MITSVDLAREKFAIDMLAAVESSLEHHCKCVLRSLRLDEDHA